MKASKIFIMGFALSLLISPAFAETIWHIAEGPSSVKFKINHLVFTVVEGKFKEFSGTVLSDGENMEGAALEARIQTESIATGIEDRDKHLISETFFDSSNFPEMIFKSQKIEKMDDKECYKIIGELTIRDITKVVELMADCNRVKQLANGKTRMDFEATTKINRSDYGLNWNEWLDTKAVVGEEVEILLDIALVKSSS